MRNEADNIAPLVAEIAAALAKRAFEIVCGNDGSTDATEAQLCGLMAKHPWLRQIRHLDRLWVGILDLAGMWWLVLVGPAKPLASSSRSCRGVGWN